MQCPFCTAILPEDDLFCEECGKPLRPSSSAVCLCGAPEGDLDDDGYCLQCGRRCRPAPGDHFELELSKEFAAVSDRGLRHRDNEDRCQIGATGSKKILIVCDGVSSSTDAGEAAEAASSTLLNALSASDDLDLALQGAAEAVAQLANGTSDASPSTTAVVAVVEGGQVRIGWVGDSRAYWIASTESRQLTKDHSWLNDVVTSGEMTYQEATQSPRAHGITRWLGADSTTAADFTTFSIPSPGVLLVCSDGLWNYLPEIDELASLLLQHEIRTALEQCRALVQFANDKGGADNISVALLQFRH